jgi:ABC-type Fe3+-hydroxamate transport system substrate-binding protein
MKRPIVIDLYGEQGNNAIVRMPGRRNAGVVVQADTLTQLARQSRKIAKLVATQPPDAELGDEAEALAEQLEDLVSKLRSELKSVGESLDV